MTVSTAIRWPAAAAIPPPRAPLRATIARVIFEHAVARVPVRVSYPDGRVLGAGPPASPEFAVVRPAAFFARLGRERVEAAGLTGLVEVRVQDMTREPA